jgi:tetratricopeptide (TPR) repeat protein
MDNSNPTAAAGAPPAPAPARLRDRKGRPYVPAVGPRLKVLLLVIFAFVAVLGATGVYLLAIRIMEAVSARTYTNSFTIAVFMAHVILGVLLILPFLVFGSTHLVTSRTRPNRRAVRLGITLFTVSILVGVSGLALIQLSGLPQLPTGTVGRNVAYYAHVLLPVLAVGLYTLHRWAGPDIKWRWGAGWGLGVGVTVAAMAAMHFQHPKDWYRQGPKEGETYFLPSAVHTDSGNFLSEEALTSNEYCLKCHQDIYDGWFHSAHHFATVNNPAYLFSVKETRAVTMKRDGNVQGSRWCAGCHDPVPFLTGAFEDPRTDPKYDPNSPRDRRRLERYQEFEDVVAGKMHPRDSKMTNGGITCVTCHAMTHIDSTVGNGAYTIEEPEFYPFTFSTNPVLQWLNNQVVKAKPDFHKKTFLKDFHKKPEFCSTCHKVSIPMALNHYKEFLRGQNHYDTFLLSGTHNGSRSFYYPPRGQENCSGCHMPLRESGDFGSRDFDGSGTRKVHNHLFPGANTGLPWLLSLDPRYEDHADALRKAADAQADFLRDKQLRIDLFGLRQGEAISDPLVAPLRPELPRLKPGRTYLVEVVVRTLKLGHPFTQGTTDSNEVWVDFEARSGGRVIGRSGALDGPDDTGRVDEWSHFANVLMLDRHGERINRRNPQDIFTPLYNHQIAPGAGQVVHYRLDVPADVTGPVELKVRLRYRKFDFEYMSLVFGGAGKVPKLPIIDLCEDHLTLPVEGVAAEVPAQTSPITPAWQRWNDYGIGLFLAATSDPKKPGLRQAEEVFRQLSKTEPADPQDEKQAKEARDAQASGWLNLARVFQADARVADAEKALHEARDRDAPWWTVAWFSGLVNAENYNFEDAARDFEEILDTTKQPRERKLDFTKDYVVINELGQTLYNLAQKSADEPELRDDYLHRAVDRFESTLELDSEDLDAHFFLSKCYTWLGKGMPEAAAPDGPPSGDEKGLLDLAGVLANGKAARDARLQAAVQLGRGVTALGQQPTQPNAPKLPTLLALRRVCRDTYRSDADPGIRLAAAHGLGNVYRETHAIYKPDDNAQEQAVARYRGDHPAAAQASYAVVIYPTAPGHAGARAE